MLATGKHFAYLVFQRLVLQRSGHPLNQWASDIPLQLAIAPDQVDEQRR